MGTKNKVKRDYDMKVVRRGVTLVKRRAAVNAFEFIDINDRFIF